MVKLHAVGGDVTLVYIEFSELEELSDLLEHLNWKAEVAGLAGDSDKDFGSEKKKGDAVYQSLKH